MEPILSAENFARNSGSQTQQKAFKIAVILVLNMQFTYLYVLTYISINASFIVCKKFLPVTDKKFLPATRNFF